MRNLTIVCRPFSRFSLIFAAFLPFAAVSGAQAAQKLPLPVAAALREAKVGADAIGIVVQEAGAKKSWLLWNEKQALVPASTIKLLTTQAALQLLGPQYRWQTSLLGHGYQQGAVWHGDVVLAGSLDPKLVLENTSLLLRQLRARGIREIDGNLWLERSALRDEEEAGATPPIEGDGGQGASDSGVNNRAARFDGDPIRAYNVLPDALLLNFSTTRLYFWPQAGQNRVKVTAEPGLGLVVDDLPLVAGACDDWHEQLGAQFVGQNLRFSGSYPAACGEKVWDVHPYSFSRDLFAERLLRELWQELGGRIRGQIKSGELSKLQEEWARQASSSAQSGTELQVLARWDSPPLAEIVRDINKFSNNVMARQVFLTLGRRALQVQRAQIAQQAQLVAQNGTVQAGALQAGTTQDSLENLKKAAQEQIQQWLRTEGLSMPELVLENGSGLSRQEKIAAQSLANLLQFSWQHALMPEFIASLPLAGVDGTMRHRLQEGSASARAHIKTGTLNGVRSVAGYVQAQSGKRYVLVAIINHARAAQGRAALDALINWVAEKG